MARWKNLRMRTNGRTLVFLALLGTFAVFGVTQHSRGAEELTAELKTELQEIQGLLKSLDEKIGKSSLSALELGVTNAKQRIKEFAIDAELLPDDPVIKKLNETVASVEKRASEAERQFEMKRKQESKPKEKKASVDRKTLTVKAPVDLKNVSFKKDVAPIVANVCMGCHNATRKSGEFDASTYNSFVEQIDVGNPESSHLMQLVTGKAQPRMPRGGMARFDKDWVDIWSAWIKQGAKFDGTSKTAPITSYLIDLEKQRLAAINALSDEELETLHRSNAAYQMDLVSPAKKVSFQQTKHFLVYTTLPESDLEFVATLAEATLEELRLKFAVKQPIFRGRLGLVVLADRFDYLAFARQIDNYEPEKNEFGHLRMRPEFQYTALTTEHPECNIDGLVALQVTRAFLAQLGDRKLPPWAAYGFAHLQAIEMDSKSTGFKDDFSTAYRLATDGKSVSDLLEDKLPWIEASALSASFFQAIYKADKKATIQFLTTLAQSGDWKQAANALNASPQQLTQVWQTWLQKNVKGKARKSS